MITLRQILAPTAAQKVSAYIPHTGMAGMLPAVCTKNLNPHILVMKSAKDRA